MSPDLKLTDGLGGDNMTAVSLQRMQQSGTLGQIFWPAALQGFGAVPSDAGDGTIRFGRIRWFFRAATTQPDCLPQDAREQCEPLDHLD